MVGREAVAGCGVTAEANMQSVRLGKTVKPKKNRLPRKMKMKNILCATARGLVSMNIFRSYSYMTVKGSELSRPKLVVGLIWLGQKGEEWRRVTHTTLYNGTVG